MQKALDYTQQRLIDLSDRVSGRDPQDEPRIWHPNRRDIEVRDRFRAAHPDVQMMSLQVYRDHINVQVANPEDLTRLPHEFEGYQVRPTYDKFAREGPGF